MFAFRIGKIPVRIHGSFFLTAAFLSLGGRQTMSGLLTWVGVVLVSVVIHELGHATMGKLFGLSPEIDLHGMGGTTSWGGGRDVGTAKSIAISLAGPGIGIALGGALWFFARGAIDEQRPVVQLVVSTAIFVNLWWGLFNLVPMLPLDGGNVLRAALIAALARRGAVIAHFASLVVAVALAITAWVVLRDWWVPLLCGLFAAQNWRAIQALRALEVPTPPPTPYGNST